MRSITGIFASAAFATAAVAIGGLVQPAAAQQDYSTLPGYSARPPGMCWYREFGSGNDQSGYWAACKNSSANASANGGANASQRNRLDSYARRR
ncbi:MAG TPA: hypothetical protein VH684_19525 [Xanthobacteraceae bacterium]|jgi:hypothetical protein